MSDIICVLSETTGRFVRVRVGDLALHVGDLCLIESEFGGDLATVVDTRAASATTPKPPGRRQDPPPGHAEDDPQVPLAPRAGGPGLRPLPRRGSRPAACP